MLRRIIQIDEEKCTGCGICADACHEGAIAIVDGKARLTRDDYCDGFGDCLPGCPTGAISFIEKDTLAYDEEAVMLNKKKKEAQKAEQAAGKASSGCPGSRMASFDRGEDSRCPDDAEAASAGAGYQAEPQAQKQVSQLRQWPCQIKLVPVNAPYFDGAKLLIAADCTAYAYAGVHQEYMRGRITLIGCPKLDAVDYSEKLTRIISENDIREVTILRMEVPCCGGLERAAVNALKASGKFLPWQVVTFTIDGRIKD